MQRTPSITRTWRAVSGPKARAKRAERAELTADWVIDELRKIASTAA